MGRRVAAGERIDADKLVDTGDGLVCSPGCRLHVAAVRRQRVRQRLISLEPRQIRLTHQPQLRDL
jgi:hypothetical protein